MKSCFIANASDEHIATRDRVALTPWNARRRSVAEGGPLGGGRPHVSCTLALARLASHHADSGLLMHGAARVRSRDLLELIPRGANAFAVAQDLFPRHRCSHIISYSY